MYGVWGANGLSTACQTNDTFVFCASVPTCGLPLLASNGSSAL